jgi:hypothetical protein
MKLDFWCFVQDELSMLASSSPNIHDESGGSDRGSAQDHWCTDGAASEIGNRARNIKRSPTAGESSRLVYAILGPLILCLRN